MMGSANNPSNMMYGLSILSPLFALVLLSLANDL